MATLEELKAKYASVLKKGESVGLRLQNMHLKENKIYLRGTLPTNFAKDQVWDEIKRIDSKYADLTADFSVQSGFEYTVKSGDSLSKIAKQFYGDAKLYPKIFDANKDKLTDPDKIQVGQVLKLP